MTMSLKEDLNNDLKKAMKDGDTTRRSVIRMVMSVIHNAEIAKHAALGDSDILGIISKEIRQRQESIDAFTKGNRPDLVSKEESEKAILEEYLPEQMSHDEIVEVARKIIEEVGARGPGDKGKVMPKIIPQLKGKADGREINTVVTELLSEL